MSWLWKWAYKFCSLFLGPPVSLLKPDWDSNVSQFVSELPKQSHLHATWIPCPVWFYNTNIYLYCRGGIHINILSCKTIWHFGEWVKFEKLSLKFCCGKTLKWYLYNNWILTVSQLHCPISEFSKKNWHKTYKVIPNI